MTRDLPSTDLPSTADLLNAQTGQLSWGELQRHFAAGRVLVVAAEADLIDTATAVVENRTADVQAWLDSGRLHHADLDDARAWEAAQPVFWAVVCAPWVLVQLSPQP